MSLYMYLNDIIADSMFTPNKPCSLSDINKGTYSISSTFLFKVSTSLVTVMVAGERLNTAKPGALEVIPEKGVSAV